MATELERVVDADTRDVAPVEAQTAIRLRIGPLVYCVPVADLMGALRDDNLPDFVTGRGATGKAAALRSGVKALLPVLWPLLVADVKRWSAELEAATGCPPLPLPDLKTRHPDGLIYAMRYIAALLLAVLCATEWQADSEPLAGHDGYVWLTRLSGASGTPTASGQAAAADGSGGPTDN